MMPESAKKWLERSQWRSTCDAHTGTSDIVRRCSFKKYRVLAIKLLVGGVCVAWNWWEQLKSSKAEGKNERKRERKRAGERERENNNWSNFQILNLNFWEILNFTSPYLTGFHMLYLDWLIVTIWIFFLAATNIIITYFLVYI